MSVPLRLAGRAILCFLAFLTGCARQPSRDPAAAKAQEPKTIQPTVDRRFDDVARFLAGLPGTEGSPYKALERLPAWKDQGPYFDDLWRGMEQKTLTQMRTFAKERVNPQVSQTATVFYPFGGPDALIVLTLFPDRPRYVLIGLEPPGTLPRLAAKDEQQIAKSLERIRGTLYSILHRSFFITREMDRSFRGQVTDGLLVPILVLLVRSGHTVLDVRYVWIDPAGELQKRGAADRDASGKRFPNRGVEIFYQKSGGGPVQTLYFFSVDLGPRLASNGGFLNYMDRLGRVATFLKATSYMTHRDEFQAVRSLVLERSDAILQDDSGIPFKYFAEADWELHLFGTYDKPYGSFRYLQQPDLKAAFEKQAKPLAFRIGYGFGKVPSNLLLGVRKSSAARR